MRKWRIGGLLVLTLKGHAGTPIWAMRHVNGEIGLRLDCGHGGFVVLSDSQAREVIESLTEILGEATE